MDESFLISSAFAPSSSIDNQSIAINKIVENINEYRKEIEDTVFFTTMIDILKQVHIMKYSHL